METKLGNGLRDELEFLLTEVEILAAHLKSAARVIHRKEELPVGSKRLLQLLWSNGPQTVPQIARARASSRQNIQMLVNHLAEGGWVECVENPAHKRSDRVRLTGRGEAMLNVAIEREARFLEPLLNQVTEQEILSAGKLLSRLRAFLDGQQSKLSTDSPKQRNESGHDFISKREKRPEPSRTMGETDEELPVNLL